MFLSRRRRKRHKMLRGWSHSKPLQEDLSIANVAEEVVQRRRPALVIANSSVRIRTSEILRTIDVDKR